MPFREFGEVEELLPERRSVLPIQKIKPSVIRRVSVVPTIPRTTDVGAAISIVSETIKVFNLDLSGGTKNWQRAGRLRDQPGRDEDESKSLRW